MTLLNRGRIAMNQLPGWVREMGVTILTASADEVTYAWGVTAKHHRGDGIVRSTGVARSRRR